MNAMVSKSDLLDRVIEYKPLGESETIKLSISLVRQWMIKPTKRGKVASDEDVMHFMMLCKARELNPWVGDAYCIGYDNDDGSATFSLITSAQALFKRAESHPEYDGIESGVIVKLSDGTIVECVGDFHQEALVGGWARVYRKDKSKPFTERIKFATFNKRRSVWNTDPEGMISKCAEVGALRKAFPNQLGGLYLREEMDAHLTVDGTAKNVDEMDAVADSLEAKRKQSPAITHTAEGANLQEQLAAAKSAREQAEAVAAKSAAAEETNKARAASEAQIKRPVEQSEPDLIGSLRQRIEGAQSPEELKVVALAIKKAGELDDEQKQFLTRRLNEKMNDPHAFA